MKEHNLSIIIVLIVLMNTLCFGQKTTGDDVEMHNISGSSPNASSLGNYGLFPVGLFTGTPQINIPLYNFEEGRLSIPISLDYRSNGIRVDEIASNVGHGWNLQAGGVITRLVVDDPDEAINLTLPDNFPGAYTQEVLDYMINATNSEDGYDTQSDVYSFNFNGYSGKFYMDNEGNPRLTNPAPLTIARETGVEGFKIIDGEGVMYFFGGGKATEYSMHQNLGSGQNGYTLKVPTSWYLYKITNNFGDEITLNYFNHNQIYYSSLYQEISHYASGTTGLSPGTGLIQTKSNTSTAELSSIETSGGRMKFNYSDYNSDFRKLDGIVIYDRKNIVLKSFELDYDEVNSSLSSLNNDHIIDSDTYYNRLFLSTITEQDKNAQKKPPHTFTYYNPTQIPPRFSYAQDYWGYYNGESSNKYLVSSGDYFFENDSNRDLLKTIFTDVGGNKEPNEDYSVNGMLKRVTYPTNGYNEILYEGHRYYGKKTIYPNKKRISASISNDINEFGQSKVRSTAVIPITQTQLPLRFSAYRAPCFENNWPSHKIKGSIQVKVMHPGTKEFVLLDKNERIYLISPTHGTRTYIGSQVVATEGYAENLYIDFIEGNRYQIETNVSFECVGVSATILYYAESPYDIDTNIQVGGQRVNKIVTDDGLGNKEIKNYHYGDFECIDCSRGIAQPPIPAISYSRITGRSSVFENISNKVSVDKLTLSSSTLYNVYSTGGHQIGYTSVIEEFGDNFENGGVLHKYRIIKNSTPPPFDLAIVGTPFDTNFGTGEEIETKIFIKDNTDFKILEETFINYIHNPSLDYLKKSFKVRQRDIYGGYSYNDLNDKIDGFDVALYYTRSNWRYINEIVKIKYDQNGLNPITITNEFDYENSVHLQPTKMTTTTSKGEYIETKTYYPDDITGINSLSFGSLTTDEYTAITRMQKDGVVHQIDKPIQQETYVNDELTSIKRTNFSTTDNVTLPSSVESAYGDEDLEEKITYHSYTENGKPEEVSRPDGLHTIYIWGYNNQYPIAKIDNATYEGMSSSIQTLITNAEKAADADDDRTLDNLNSNGIITYQGKEGLLRKALNNLRTNNYFKNSMLTTYTYDPLIGITSVTDSKGYIMYYQYDGFQRLEIVKDADGNLISTNDYNYKN